MHLIQVKGWLRIEDVNEDSGSGRGVGLSHDVFDVFFYSLFGNLQNVGNFFVGPAVSSPVKETMAKENFWLQVGPDSGQAVSPPTTHGAALRYTAATIRR